MSTINASCPECKKPMEVVVGRKSTARTVECEHCHAKYDYSCWVIKRGEGRVFTKIELFPMREDRRSWIDEMPA